MSSNRWRRRGGDTRHRTPGRRRLGPAVLTLEDRRLMTTVIPVTSAWDTGGGTLRDALVQAASTPGAVEIDFRIATPATIDLAQGPLELSDTNGPVSIVGPGAADLTIDAGGASRVLRIDPGVKATVSGLTFADGQGQPSPSYPGSSYFTYGGDVENQGTLTLSGVTLSGGTARGGAGLYNTGTADLSDCTVTANIAQRGALENEGLDASMSLVDCSVSGNLFTGNSYSEDGFGGTAGPARGILNLYGRLSVVGTTFLDNDGQGAAVVSAPMFSGPDAGQGGTLTMSGCTIAGNSGGFLVGGVQSFGDDSTIEDCAIVGNSGVGLDCAGGLTVSDCTVVDNSNPYFGFGGGGVTVQSGTVKIIGCTISGNSGVEGAGVFNEGQATLVGCTISDNSADSFGGGILNGGTLTVEGCDVANNSAGISAGGFSNTSGQATLSDCRLADNHAGYNGGGINVFSGALTIANSSVIGNSADGEGGGLFVYSGSSYSGALTMKDVTVSGNSAAQGGGIFNANSLTATGVILSGNAATTGGGIDNAPGATATLTGSSIVGNAASGDGGGIDNVGSIKLTGSLLLGNSAAGDGGGLDNSGTAMLTDCLVTLNAAASGGGIDAAAGGTVTLTETLVILNKKDNIDGTVNDG